MRAEPQPIRATHLAVTATTLVALVAMSAAVAAAPAARGPEAQRRSESLAVRTVAAAARDLLGAARDLVTAERSTAALGFCEPRLAPAAASPCGIVAAGPRTLPPPLLVRPSLVDLPPPAA